MSKKLFKWINEKAWNKTTKNKIFIVCSVLSFCFVGMILWLPFMMILPGVETFICFVGYPGFFLGFIGGIVFLYNHELS